MPGPIFHHFFFLKFCYTGFFRESCRKKGNIRRGGFPATVRLGKKVQHGMGRALEPLSSRHGQGGPVCSSEQHLHALEGRSLEVEWGVHHSPLESTLNLTRGKRRLKVRGSWQRRWPLEKPKKLSPSEIGALAAKHCPGHRAAAQFRLESSLKSPWVPGNLGFSWGCGSGQSTPVGYLDQTKLGNRASQQLSSRPTRPAPAHSHICAAPDELRALKTCCRRSAIA